MHNADSQSTFIKKSMEWVFAHVALAKWICNPDEPISQEDLKAELERAILTQDYAYYGLLMYQQELRHPLIIVP
ncbi:hypothetical protein RFF05_07605 [Bengtsoniella intestinalis]|uniref:hypothetical protein n=1 Tax=Bengtsoniella intestinalis TaxID=3073143 RepID=UPI00391F148A